MPTMQETWPCCKELLELHNLADPKPDDQHGSHHKLVELPLRMHENIGNFSQYSEYSGPKELIVGEGSGLHIKNSGSTILPTLAKPLVLSNVLHDET